MNGDGAAVIPERLPVRPSRVGPVTALLLLAGVVARESGLTTEAVATMVSIVVVTAAALWAARGPDRPQRLSELYLWLAFIVSVYHLHVVAAAVAGRLAVTPLTVFRPLAVAHVLVVCAAMWTLKAWSRDAAGSGLDLRRVAAALFIAGAVIFWVGARTFPGMALDAVAGNVAGYQWTSANFLLATVITIVGLTLLARALHEAGDRVLASLGLIVFTFGSVFWVVHLVFRMTVVVQAADAWRVTAMTPDWYEPWRGWAGLLFAVYSVLAYLGLAAYGGALLGLQWVPRWIGWTCVLAGVLAAPLGGLPLFIHVPLWLAGIAFLTRAPAAARAPAAL
jgi:hypothetical protein